jgi:hypothetical protein
MARTFKAKAIANFNGGKSPLIHNGFWISADSLSHIPASITEMGQMANVLLSNRGSEPTILQRVGKNRVQAFLHRHPELSESAHPFHCFKTANEPSTRQM